MEPIGWAQLHYYLRSIKIFIVAFCLNLKIGLNEFEGIEYIPLLQRIWSKCRPWTLRWILLRGQSPTGWYLFSVRAEPLSSTGIAQNRTLSDSPASPRSLRNRFVTSVWRNCSFGTFGRQHFPLKGQTIVNFKINVESFVVLSLAGNTTLFRWKLVLLTDLWQSYSRRFNDYCPAYNNLAYIGWIECETFALLQIDTLRHSLRAP